METPDPGDTLETPDPPPPPPTLQGKFEFTYVSKSSVIVKELKSGKRIVLERPADVMFSVAYLGVGDPNYQLQNRRYRNPGYVGHTQGDVLRTSDIELCTAGHCFTEDPDLSVPVGLEDVDNSGNVTTAGATPINPGGVGLYSRRWYCQRIGFPNLPAGVHHFYVAINPRCDRGHIKVLMSEVEVFHRKAASRGQG